MPEQINDKAITWIPKEYIEDQALNQIKDLSKLPFIVSHIAVMPDCHYGIGATIGTVLPTHKAIIPAAVGVDIGCGMVAGKTPLKKSDLPADLSDIRKAIQHQIPNGAGRYNKKIKKHVEPYIAELEAEATRKSKNRLEFYDNIDKNWRRQIGTLGSGNHFIELVADEEESVWTFIHSGSRGIGNKLASHYMKEAKKMMKLFYITLPNPDLAYFPLGTEEFYNYWNDLQWAVQLAHVNRLDMVARVFKILEHRLGQFDSTQIIDTCHNYSRWEHHFNQNVIVTRKGAISAKEGELGLIPGALGTPSYVVRGKGCKPALNSAPHGAGRVMSRRKARKLFTMDDFDVSTKGVELERTEKILDELPAAYKDIGLVMGYSKDLVDIVHTFTPLINVKG